jgi:hypothetical protein
MKSSVFWDITACSAVKVNLCIVWAYCLYLQDRRVSQTIFEPEASSKQSLLYSFTLKVEAIQSSETSADLHETIWRYIPEDRTLQN